MVNNTIPFSEKLNKLSERSHSTMKFLHHIPAWLRNKYLICLAGFIVWMLFFDPRDFFSQVQKTKEKHRLELVKSRYVNEISKESAELEALKNDPAVIEKYAREKYYMKKDNEDLFIIQENYESGKD